LLVIGDSLGVGTRPYLQNNGRRTTQNVKGGRTLAEGMRIYARTPKPRVVAMGLFTNDDPRNVAKLRSAVLKTVSDARRTGGRVVWATIHRPAVNGVTYGRANEILRSMARQHSDVMGLVDWDRSVKANPRLLQPDGIHATAAGYRHRAKAYAQAARASE